MKKRTTKSQNSFKKKKDSSGSDSSDDDHSSSSNSEESHDKKVKSKNKPVDSKVIPGYIQLQKQQEKENVEEPLDPVQKLHDEIMKSLKRDKVDPFQRKSYLPQDELVDAVHTIKPHWPTNKMDYWRGWSSKRIFLEKKSLEEVKRLEKLEASGRLNKKPPKKKVSQQKYVTKTPKYSFAPPPKAAATFDSHLIGPINPVKHLLKSLNKTEDFGDIERPKSSSKGTGKINVREPIVLVAGDIGEKAKGGAMNMALPRPMLQVSITQGCTYKTTEELEPHRKIKGGTLPASPRFQETAEIFKVNRNFDFKSPNKPLKAEGGVFCNEPRFPRDDIKVAPTCTTYQVPRLFDNIPPKVSPQRALELRDKVMSEESLRKEPVLSLSKMGKFGYGCSFEEHVKYGLCLDGLCCRRAKWEEVTLISNNYCRLQGSPKKTSQTLNPVEKLNRQLEETEFSPLQTAALNGDLENVIMLYNLGYDVNAQDRLQKRNILHNAVERGHVRLVMALAPDRESYEESIFKGLINLNCQDVDGNTPLHIAASSGHQLITEILCDAGAEPEKIKNFKNQSPIDCAKTQKIFQILKLASTRLEAEQELAKVRKQSRKMSRLKSGRSSKSMILEDEEDDEKKPEEVPLESRQVEKHSFHVGYLDGDPIRIIEN